MEYYNSRAALVLFLCAVCSRQFFGNNRCGRSTRSRARGARPLPGETSDHRHQIMVNDTMY
jgi:hypothetical protein